MLSNYDEAMTVLATNAPKISKDMATCKRKQVQEFLFTSKRLPLVIYGPTPDQKYRSGFLNFGSGRFQITSVNVKGKKRKVYAELGASRGQGSRITGVGHLDSDKRGSGSTQWFRMDWHSDHGVETRDWSVPNSYGKSYHFHTCTAR